MANHFISSEIYRATGYGPAHPLGIERVGTVLSLCEQLGWLGGKAPGYVDSPAATVDELARFHDPAYVEAVRTAGSAGLVPQAVRERYRIGTMENPVFQGLFQRASTSVGGSMLAARLAAQGGIAYHPSGGTHHGMPDHASGFCYFNDPVFAILALLDAGKERVLYADLDAHHGDGVEAAFRGDDRVFLISIHEENRWPNTGLLEDRSTGNARNLPVPREFNDSELRHLMSEAVLPLAGRFAPDAVVITCGADCLLGDPLSSMALGNASLWDAVMDLAAIAPSTVVLGGGGYNPWTVARCWTGLWGRIQGYPIPDALPEESRKLLETLSCDLVDEDEMLPFWTATLADPPNKGPVRQRIREIARAVMEP